MNDDELRIRSIEVEVEVPGTPEQVWEAIATGPGITAWFVPAEVSKHEGGTVAFDMGSGMEELGVVTGWEPPHRFAYEEEWQAFEERPAAKLATEFLVEARSGGTCVVRVVNSLFASGADWDDQLERMREGWSGYLQILRLYLTHFPGQRCSTILVLGNSPGPKDRAWAALTGALGLSDAAEGEPAATGHGVPALTGVVERVADDWLVIRTDQPVPGVAVVHVSEWRGRVYTSLHAYLFGEEAPAVAARDEPVWRAWTDEHFPAVATLS